MKFKSVILIAALTLASAIGVSAQPTTNQSLFIKGNMDIRYVTRQSPPNTKGIQDIYDINLNVANSVIFRGKITDRPQVMEGYITKTIVQPRSLKYSVSCDVMNPNNPSQVVKDVSKLDGFVNIATTGEYNYNGGLGFNVLNRMAGSDSKFRGIAAGKPLVRPPNWMDTLKRETVNITRNVNGKRMTVQLKKYDKMEFRSLTLAAGPVPMYTDAVVNGEMLYDYDKNTWFFNNMTVNYTIINKTGETIAKTDRITGTIRWVEDDNRKVNGKGEYQFDIRVNEPLVSETAAFTAAAEDESAFFTTTTTAPGLYGTMKYQDTIKNGTTMASSVAIDLNGTALTKQQLMIFNKIIIFISVVPMNAD
jgi:hypothetical protein